MNNIKIDAFYIKQETKTNKQKHFSMIASVDDSLYLIQFDDKFQATVKQFKEVKEKPLTPLDDGV